MSRELTREEKKKIRALVTKWCANYDKEYGCLPLECEWEQREPLGAFGTAGAMGRGRCFIIFS